MANEYADLATLKLSLNITDSTRDELLQAALSAASRSIDTATGRRFWLDEAPSQRTYNPRARVVRDVDGERLMLDDIGDAGGLLVETGSGGAWSTLTDYETAPDNAIARGRPVTALLRSSSSWTSGTSRVRVTARWGWPAVPAEIVEATKIQASRLYKRKDSAEGVTGSAEWGVVRLSRRDPDVWALIEHYALPGFG